MLSRSITNKDFLELETLSPLQELGRGETAEHVETWRLVDDAPDPNDELSMLVDR